MSDGRTLGTVVGGVLGFFTGGVGWALGAAIGGVAGGLLDPASNDAKPQRLEDLKVSVSTYGAGIPETWGNDVPPGTWIWTTDIQEVPQYYGSGKGGGSDEPSSYFYMVHGLVCLGKSPPPGTSVQLRKVYKDGELKWDASSGLSVLQALATEDNPFVGIQLLDGNEDQLPPAFLEIWEGAGNVPAYRGLVTVLVVGLETPGGRIPQLSFEICVGATIENQTQPLATFARHVDNCTSIVEKDGICHFDFEGGGYNQSFYMNVYVGTVGTLTPTNKFDLGVIWGDGIFIQQYFPFPLTGGSKKSGHTTQSRPHAMWVYDTDGKSFYELIDLQTGERKPVYTFNTINVDRPGRKSGGRATQDDDTSTFAIMSTAPDGTSTSILLIQAAEVYGTATAYMPVAFYFSASVLYILSHVGDSLYLERRFDAGRTTTLGAIPGPTLTDIKWQLTALMVSENGVFAYIPRGGGTAQGLVYRIDLETQEWVLLASSTGYPPEPTTTGAGCYTFFACPEYCITGPDFVNYRYNITRFKVVTPHEAEVSDVIEAQCREVGLTSGQFDVATVDDTVWGYTFNKSPSSARGNIAPLLTYAGAACVEEDGLIRYFHRADKLPGALIPWADLGCVEDGQDPADPAPLTRQQEAECPRSLTVSYLNPAFDYQTSTEQAVRLTTQSQFDEQVDLAMAISSDRAATIAHRLLYERWATRNARSTKLSRKYADLSPGDVRPLEYRDGVIGNFTAVKVTDTGALIEVEWMPSDAELLLHTVTGSQGYQGQEIQPLAPQTRMQLLDIPILRDSDDNAGIYVAMEGYAGGWPGASLFVGSDSDTLEARGAVSSPAVIGFTETALDLWSLNMVDEQSVLTVNIGEDTLATVTKAAMLAGAVNVAAVGAPGRWEIIKFRQADDLGGGRYTLRGFVRGFRGTERNRASSRAGDFFVVLSGGGVLRPALDAGQIGQAMLYKAVTKGRRYSSTEAASYTNTAESLKPFSPQNLSKAVSAGDITLSWVRRTRLTENWLAGVVPVGEATQAFEVDIFSDNTFTTVKRTIQTSTRSAVYTSAQQVADFGSNRSTLYVRVYQISDVVGRGHVLQATI